MRTPVLGLLGSLVSLVSLLAVVPHALTAQSITEFPLPTATAAPWDITAGADGNVWFTERIAAQVGRITPEGVITEFPLPPGDRFSGFLPQGITTGPDGNVWFGFHHPSGGGGVARMATGTPNTVTEFSLPVAGAVHALTSGPDGNIWFTINPINGWETRRIGTINPASPHAITLFAVVVPPMGDFYGGIAAGSDGNVWFTEYFGNKVGRITPSGVITEFDLPTPASYPGSLTLGADGNMWFVEGTNKVGRITPSGVITEFDVPDYPGGITNGPDGKIWITMGSSSIGRVGTDGVLVSTFSLPHGVYSQPLGITMGPDGNVWFTEGNGYTNAIGRITVPVLPPIIPVAIDVKPGSVTNPINPRDLGVIPVAILTTATFNAMQVDPLSVAFGPNGAGEAHGRGQSEDVNGDGQPDLVLHFRTQETGIQCQETSVALTGETFDGQAIQGTDAIWTVGCE